MDNKNVTTDGVTVREFGRQIGKSHVWVLKLIKSGDLPRNEDGTIPLDAGLKAFADYVSAPKKPKGRPKNSTITEETQPARGRGRPRKEPPAQTEKRKQGRPRKAPPVENVFDDMPNDEANEILKRKDEAVNVNSSINKVKLADMTFKAKTRELEYKEKAGDLIRKDEVAKEAQWLADQVKSKLMAIPPRISTLCEGRVAREIEEIISDALNDALRELQKCKYTGDEQ